MSRKRDSSSGYITLLDADGKLSATKKYGSISQRNDIIAYWQKLYKLENKVYGFIISPDINIYRNN
jgi:hypothetical protein